MAAPGVGQYAHAGPGAAGPDPYGLQPYPPHTAPSSSSTTSPFLLAAPPPPHHPGSANAGNNGSFHLDGQQQQFEWGTLQHHHHQPSSSHPGWLSSLPPPPPGVPGMGDSGDSSTTQAGPEGAAASTVAYPPPINTSHTSLHPLAPVQYDWQPHPRPYTPYHLPPSVVAAAPPPQGPPHPSMYSAYRTEYTPYVPPPHAPLTYQPLLSAVSHPHVQHPSPYAAPPPPPPPSDPSAGSLSLSYPSLSSYARPTSLSTTNATRDGSRAVSAPSSPGSAPADEPPALAEPHSPGQRDANGQFTRGLSIELAAHRSVPPLIPALGHINSADVARGGKTAPGGALDADGGAAGAANGGATKRPAGAPDSKSFAPPAKRKKEPKDLASRKYACNECDQRFARPSALATHVLTHTKEKPFVCCTCNRGFAVMSNLRRHCRVRSHALAPEQESSARTRPPLGSASSGSSGGSGTGSTGFVPDPGPPPLRTLAPAPPGLQAARY
ncbi:hypothetical protein JCM8208_001012 [Rhodotorula glutinis]